MRSALTCLAVCCLIGASPSFGDQVTYSLNATGDQEVGSGDPDGLATGTITLDDVTGLISWDFTYTDIVSPSLMHIHGPGGSAGSGAAVFIGLGVATSGGAGTLIDDLIHAPLTDITEILDDPTDFYVNIHNGSFSGGAVRGQLPEPGSLALLALGGLAAMTRRRSSS